MEASPLSVSKGVLSSRPLGRRERAKHRREVTKKADRRRARAREAPLDAFLGGGGSLFRDRAQHTLSHTHTHTHTNLTIGSFPETSRPLVCAQRKDENDSNHHPHGLPPPILAPPPARAPQAPVVMLPLLGARGGAASRRLLEQSSRRSNIRIRRAQTSSMAPPNAPPPFVVAVDGPAASGKGTLARRLAQHLGFRYLDTGLLYRAVGAEALRRGLALETDEAGVARAARELDLGSIGADASADLRTDEAAHAASVVSALPGVRAALLSAQREFALHDGAGAGGAVLDGRDIGTVVVPAAAAKIFVTASAEVRAERRWRELLERRRRSAEEDAAPSLETVLADLRARDARDAGRAASPLRAAEDAFVLDTSQMDADAAFEAARAFVEERRVLLRAGAGREEEQGVGA